MSDIGKHSKPNAIISSSSSGLLPSIIFSKCKNPNRGIIGHPFNPVYILPAVEIVPGKKTSKMILKKGLHIINEGYATTKDLDRAIEDGPGLRWSLMGTFLTFHLAGGKSGMKHMLEQFGPALKFPWTKLKAPKLSNKLIKRLVDGTKIQSKGKSVEKISNIRDEYLIDLLMMRKKYEKKLR